MGGILLSVHSDGAEWTSKTKAILLRNDAHDVGVKEERVLPSASGSLQESRRGDFWRAS